MPKPTTTAADRLKAVRERLGLSQDQIAKQLGIGRASWADLETGHRSPSLERLWDIAMALQIDPHTLDSRLASVKPKPKGKIPRTK
jgi:transcriptional regulator with XRE-family HTH domain